ncbi:hypothetical protein E1B28_010444 [Marasmius oreades]|uniref:Uncharacterized protein n=1 Tax=Marasmius oreades TaxID=181124 RepID=A0A9P7RXB4_9AGAR|nr:uncharacterized protein E1B28_010444 [Marasmius oreades]KAG7091407.1 hypothetical protein E1B28_010444 [Marasmius oreades]
MYPLVVRGEYRLIGIVRVLEHLVRDRGVGEFLLEGKVKRLLQAINKVCTNLLDKDNNASESAPTPEEPQSTSPPSQTVVGTDNSTCRLELAASKPKRGGMRGGSKARGSWKIPSMILPKWEAAADWKLVNPTGTLKEYEAAWSNVISKDQVQLPMYQKRASVRREATEKK